MTHLREHYRESCSFMSGDLGHMASYLDLLYLFPATLHSTHSTPYSRQYIYPFLAWLHKSIAFSGTSAGNLMVLHIA